MHFKICLQVCSILISGLITKSVLAQGIITANLVEDRQYLAPGSTYALVVEVTNPIDSGFTITRSAGGGYDSNYWHNSPPHFELKAHESCLPFGFCPIDATPEWSIEPGETRRFYHQVIHVSPDAPVGAEIRVSNIHLTLSDDRQYRQHNDIHLAHDFTGIVAAGGQGVQAVLAAIPTANPYAGSASIDATLTLNYPSVVKAGKHVEIIGTITNHGTEPISDSFILSTHRHLGNHLSSYRQIFCSFKCEFNGRFPLRQGGSMDLLFRQLYYENELLFAGSLDLLGPHAIVRDSRGRRAYLYEDDIRIQVTHDSDEPSPAPEFDLPEREPLILTTSTSGELHDLVVDPNTGLSWLPLTETQGMSLQQVVSETRPGGQFSGFSVASSDEVKSLLLNHIYASKLKYPEYALFTGSRDLHAVAGTFLDLIGATLIPEHENGSTRYGRGMVADAPEPNNETVEMSIWQQNNPDGLFGLHGTFNLNSFYRSAYEGTGTWLVSNLNLNLETIHIIEQPIKSAEEVEYEYGQLFISSVEVEDYTYKITLRMIDKDAGIIELISVLDEYNRAPSATYDVSNLVLQIPRLGLFVFPNDHLYFSVEFEYIPGTDPPQFQLTHAEDVY